MFKIGMRTLKTALSVAICIFTLGIFGIEQPFFACMTAVFTMQSNVATSFKAGLDRLLGTMTGAVTGTLFAAIYGSLPAEHLLFRTIAIPFGAMLIIHILNLLEWKDAIFIACIVYFALMLKVEHVSVLSYAIGRTLLTCFGAIVALLVNRFVYPPEKKQKRKLNNLAPSES